MSGLDKALAIAKVRYRQELEESGTETADSEKAGSGFESSSADSHVTAGEFHIIEIATSPLLSF